MRGITQSYSLLADQSALSAKQLRRIFNSMTAGDRKKSTAPGRFSELDEVIAAEVAKRFAGPISAHELGAGNAITSVELFRRLSRDREVTFRASDYYDHITVARRFGIDFISDAHGKPLQIGIGRVGIRPVFRSWPSGGRRISLFHPEAIELARTNPRFTLDNDDFFQPDPGPYHVVRLMNGIPQTASLEYRNRIITSLKRTLTPDGILIVGRRSDWSLVENVNEACIECVGAINGRDPQAVERSR